MRGTWVDYLTFTTSRFILVRSHFDMEGNLDLVAKSRNMGNQ